ncbi:hypothetical protein Cgig2_019725 [Carnegiea gigantea]|uniref:Uncharacterized protein n=1 Tax=Carnegiea gigantea TaxID=171969 RepID=A0A9Q1KNN9_9CARY|nr:hypothetical protein Cgig2_019725 [Carnegiea gigantea]
MTAENQLIEKLNDAGNRLLQAPSSTPELLDLLDEVRVVLSKVGQKPSDSVKEALLLSMKALIADQLLRNSDPDVKISVAACLNEIMRISAPVAPYDDGKMKEIFELIVSSFDSLSTLHGPCYSKAVLILENVARLRSCVMMLDLECDPLVTKMFELFLKNISSNHPRSVVLAMETIMSVMIKESDVISQELLKVLLESIRKENQDISHVSWKLGAKLIEECSEKLKPYITKAVVSMGSSLEDYAPILSVICKDEHDTAENLNDDSAKDVVNSKPSANKSHSAEFVQALKAIERCSKKEVGGAGNKPMGDPRTKSGSAAPKRGKKQSAQNHNEGNENSSSKGKTSLGSPHSHPKKSSTTAQSDEGTMAGENIDCKAFTEKTTDFDQLHQNTSLGDRSKKGRQFNNDASGGSGSRENTGGISSKDKAQTSDASSTKSQRKRASSDDDAIETPYGRKSYKEDLVGCRIKVWWPLDRRYYEGIISSYDAYTRKHKVDYDDGDEEILNLRKERWEFTGDALSADIDFVLDKRKSRLPSDGPQREGSTEGNEETSPTHIAEKGITPELGSKSGDRTHEVTKSMEKSTRSEVSSDTKRPRLSDGQQS